MALGTAKHERDPLPMADDVEATKRAGRRSLVVLALGFVAVVVFVAMCVAYFKMVVPDEDVAAARACRSFEQDVNLFPLMSPDTAAMKERAASLTGQWTQLGTSLDELATVFAADPTLGSQSQRALGLVESVASECAGVPTRAEVAARFFG